MVVVVRRTRGCFGSGTALRNTGAMGEGCQLRGRSLFAPGRVQTGEERLPQGLAGWQLCCSVQRGF